MAMKRLITGLSALALTHAHAQLTPLADNELSAIDGRSGIGLVLEHFKLDATDFSMVVNDIKDAAGNNVPISIDRLYLGAAGSKKGSALEPVTLGRLPYPLAVNLAKGEDLRTFESGRYIQSTPSGVSVIELAFPTLLPTTQGGQACITGLTGNNTCSSNAASHVDMGARVALKVNDKRTDVLTLDVMDAVMDGSHLRFWGDPVHKQLVGEARLNVFAKAVDLLACKEGDLRCNTDILQRTRTLQFTDVSASIALGYGKSQPVLFNVNSDGHFVLELPNPVKDPAKPNASVNTLSGVGFFRAKDFYENAPRINLHIGNFTSGGDRRGGPTNLPIGGYNFGANSVTGLGINYLKVTSRAL